jgi:hypothetical protein
MYHILIFLYNCFLTFVVQKMNSKMIKCGMVVLTESEKIDVAMSWMLYVVIRVLVGERKREN